MYKTIVALLLVAAVANGNNMGGWINCGSPMANVQRVRVDGCSQAPCTFEVGSTVTMEVDAISLTNSNNVPFAMTTTFLGLPITLVEGNACNHFISGSCPALNGRSFTFRLEYRVPEFFPPNINAVITATVWNDFGDVAACIQVDVRTRAASN